MKTATKSSTKKQPTASYRVSENFVGVAVTDAWRKEPARVVVPHVVLRAAVLAGPEAVRKAVLDRCGWLCGAALREAVAALMVAHDELLESGRFAD